jgi:hypothetical protein
MTAKTAKTAKSGENQPVSGQTTEFPVSSLRLFARNPRKGNIGAIAASLEAHGQYRPVVANIGTYTGRKHEVLAGNHTIQGFRLLATRHPEDPRWHRALVHWVDLDDDQAARVVLADNKTSEHGYYDADDLAGLITEVSHDFDGLGYTAVELAKLTPDFSVDIDPGAEMDLGDALEETGATLDAPRPPSTGSSQPAPPGPPPSPPSPPGPPDNGPAVLTFTIVFENPAQKAAWSAFLTWLARTDPDSSPIERLVGYLEKVLSRRLQEDEQV